MIRTKPSLLAASLSSTATPEAPGASQKLRDQRPREFVCELQTLAERKRYRKAMKLKRGIASSDCGYYRKGGQHELT